MTNVYHSDSYVLQSLYCIHVCFLLSPGEICHGGTEPNVDILSTEPFLVGMYDGTNHGLIKCTRVCGITRYHCSTCPSSNPNCNHLEVFKEWEADDSQPPTLKILHSARNAFARLLDLKFSGNFQCPVCGCSPETIICDGTLMGFRKDLLPALQRSIL